VEYVEYVENQQKHNNMPTFNKISKTYNHKNEILRSKVKIQELQQHNWQVQYNNARNILPPETIHAPVT
jgi:hypothetical protein